MAQMQLVASGRGRPHQKSKPFTGDLVKYEVQLEPPADVQLASRTHSVKSGPKAPGFIDPHTRRINSICNIEPISSSYSQHVLDHVRCLDRIGLTRNSRTIIHHYLMSGTSQRIINHVLSNKRSITEQSNVMRFIRFSD